MDEQAKDDNSIEWDIDINQPMYTRDYLQKVREENWRAYDEEFNKAVSTPSFVVNSYQEDLKEYKPQNIIPLLLLVVLLEIAVFISVLVTKT